MTIPEVEAMILQMENESKALKQELFKLCWYMRGGLSFTESFMLSIEDRELIVKIIEENLEVAKASGLPFF